MSDIVEWLRHQGRETHTTDEQELRWCAHMQEAADEIDRLRAVLAEAAAVTEGRRQHVREAILYELRTRANWTSRTMADAVIEAFLDDPESAKARSPR